MARVLGEFILIRRFLFLFLLVPVCYAADSTINALDTPEKAVEQALRYTGFEERLKDKSILDDAAGLAKKVLIEVDSTPFLRDQIEGREMWMVRFIDVDIRTEFKINLGVPPEYRSFTVVLDPAKGWLARVFSDPVRDRPDLLPKPSGEVAEKKIHFGAGEVWHEFPDSLPGINFIQALDASPACFPIMANEISGHYVIFSDNLLKQMPIWHVMVRGIMSPIRQEYRPDGNYKLCGRCAVDAVTGEPMFSTSAPTADE